MRLCPGESAERNVINASKKGGRGEGEGGKEGVVVEDIEKGNDQTIEVKWIPWNEGSKRERD